MMNSQNPQWNTPPHGDFASYVERLSAQALLPRRQAQEGEPGLDVGMAPQQSGASGAVTAAQQQQRLESSNGEAPDAGRGSAGTQVALVTRLGLASLLAMAVLWSLGVPLNVLGVILALGLWFVFKLKRMKLRGLGPAKWQRVLEEAARKQKELQQRQTR